MTRLLQQCGRGPAEGLIELAGGANNRVYRVLLSDGAALLKWYFSDPHDPHDRLQCEWAFADFAWAHGLRQLPQPLACDQQRRLGLFEFVDGRLLTVDELTRDRIHAAVDFCRELNRFRDSEPAQQLGAAAEACFSIEAHLTRIDQRVSRLRSMVQKAAVPPPARELCIQRLLPQWRDVEARIRAEAARSGIDLRTELPAASRVLSPSDFGFHNALLDTSGALRFFDFEYAGWDDPAKTICDFFCQIAVPVPPRFRDEFARSLLADLAEPTMLERRAELLMPAYRVKWCCIVLNPLLVSGQRRRAFSHATEAPEVWMDKARRILDQG
ncbi:MAG: aminoglycoside phosphotransferase family protein [Pirellulaceae bacterium]